MIEVAPLHYGVIFKKAFSNIDIFKAFVKDLLGIELEITEVGRQKNHLIPLKKIKQLHKSMQK